MKSRPLSNKILKELFPQYKLGGNKMKSRLLSNKILKELFPQYKKEIELFSKVMACGCSRCIWIKLKYEHPEIELPDPDAVYICI